MNKHGHSSSFFGSSSTRWILIYRKKFIALFTLHSLVSRAMAFISLGTTSKKVGNKTTTRTNRVPHRVRWTVKRTPVRQKVKPGPCVHSRILLTKVPAWILGWMWLKKAKRRCRVILRRYISCNPTFIPVKLGLKSRLSDKLQPKYAE